ncbi:MAG: hypothetical protein KDB03_17575 [Planctomycetales bacterium]|nr:hypothetical protein [Planctomycetales bacterium]
MSSIELRLLIGFLVAVALLIVLIVRYQLPPFIALLVATLGLAVIGPVNLDEALTGFSSGLGGVLGSTAMIIGLGAIIGGLLESSGGAAAIAHFLLRRFGAERAHWTMLLVGLLVGVGVWFTVGLVLLVPVVMTFARTAGIRLLVPAMSMLAGLSAMHGLAPPHPGPLVGIQILHADLGQVIVWSLGVGSVAALISGPIFWRYCEKFVDWPAQNDSSQPQEKQEAGLWRAALVLVLPIALMLIGSTVSNFQNEIAELLGDRLIGASAPQDVVESFTWLRLAISTIVGICSPTVAMLVGVLLAYYCLGTCMGLSKHDLAKITERSLLPVANVLLVVGAGAGFSRVLIQSGVGEILANLISNVPLPPMVLGWLIAAAFRIATGSATTALTAACGIVASWLEKDPSIDPNFMVLALGSGSLTLSHVNDGGFWFVKEYFGLSVEQTLRTWTVLETVMSLVALAILVILDWAI